MARSKVIFTGDGSWYTTLNPLTEWCKENLRECCFLDVPLTDEKARQCALDIYMWAQVYKKTNTPKITESLCHRAVCELGDWSEKL